DHCAMKRLGLRRLAGARAAPRGRRKHSAARAPARSRPYSHRLRQLLLFSVLSVAALALLGRAVNLQLVDHGFLTQQGNQRFSRVASIVAHRGSIIDRDGAPLAISTPVDSI